MPTARALAFFDRIPRVGQFFAVCVEESTEVVIELSQISESDRVEKAGIHASVTIDGVIRTSRATGDDEFAGVIQISHCATHMIARQIIDR